MSEPMTEPVTCERCAALAVRLDSLEAMATEREARNKERFDNIATATAIATSALDKRLDGMNEFRQSLRDQADKFVDRNFYKTEHASLSRQVDDLKQHLVELEKTEAARTSIRQEKREGVNTLYYAIGSAGVLFAVVTSLVTVVYNIYTYNAHTNIAATVGQVEAGDAALSRRLDALEHNVEKH
jgi:hypothetical protein